MIRKRHLYAGIAHELGEKVRGDAGGFMSHQVITIKVKQLGIFGANFPQPFFEIDGVVYAFGNQLVIKRGDQFIIDQYIQAARFVFEIFYLANEFLVVRKKWRARLKVAAC